MRNQQFSLSKTFAGLLLATACAAACSTAFAAPTLTPFDTAAVLEQQKQIRADADAGNGAYGKLSPDARKELSTRQDRLSKLLDGRRYEDLNEADREQAHQDLGWIQSAGAGGGASGAEEKLICERVRAIGSNRIERVCKTAAQRREEQKNRVDPKLEMPGARH